MFKHDQAGETSFWLQRRSGSVSLCPPLDGFIDLISISHFTCEWGGGLRMGSAASPTIAEQHETSPQTEISPVSKSNALLKHLLAVDFCNQNCISWKVVADFTSLFCHMLESFCVKTTCLKQSS